MYRISTLLFIILTIHSKVSAYDQDADLNLQAFTSKLGISLEKYEIILSDGYTISIFRIKRRDSIKLQPVLLIHGLGSCVEIFFVMKNSSIPHLLLNNSYDAWILSPRGTPPSLGHTKLDSKTDSKYWQFSFEDIAVNDITSAIDFVLAKNVHQKVHIIAISEGTTITLVALAQVPKNREKVGLSVLLGPPATLFLCCDCLKMSFMKIGCRNADFLKNMAQELNLYSPFLIPHTQLRELLYYLCKSPSFYGICREFLRTVFGNYEQIKQHDVSYLTSKYFCSGSMKDVIHHFQIGKTGRIARFDYGEKRNLIEYNSTEPPLYPFHDIKNPIIMWCGNDDFLCHEPELKKWATYFPNVVSSKLVGTPEWTHMDFSMAKDVGKYVYKEMLYFLKIYSSNNNSILQTDPGNR